MLHFWGLPHAQKRLFSLFYLYVPKPLAPVDVDTDFSMTEDVNDPTPVERHDASYSTNLFAGDVSFGHTLLFPEDL